MRSAFFSVMGGPPRPGEADLARFTRVHLADLSRQVG